MHVVVPKRRRSFSRSRLPEKRVLTALALLPHQPLCFPHNRRGRKRFFHDVLLLLDVNFVGPRGGACRQSTAHILQAPVLGGESGPATALPRSTRLPCFPALPAPSRFRLFRNSAAKHRLSRSSGKGYNCSRRMIATSLPRPLRVLQASRSRPCPSTTESGEPCCPPSSHRRSLPEKLRWSGRLDVKQPSDSAAATSA